jgi:ABC-type Fe3+/spermidine/putrescine transport system ATPase subunit
MSNKPAPIMNIDLHTNTNDRLHLYGQHKTAELSAGITFVLVTQQGEIALDVQQAQTVLMMRAALKA